MVIKDYRILRYNMLGLLLISLIIMYLSLYRLNLKYINLNIFLTKSFCKYCAANIYFHSILNIIIVLFLRKSFHIMIFVCNSILSYFSLILSYVNNGKKQCDEKKNFYSISLPSLAFAFYEWNTVDVISRCKSWRLRKFFVRKYVTQSMLLAMSRKDKSIYSLFNKIELEPFEK